MLLTELFGKKPAKIKRGVVTKEERDMIDRIFGKGGNGQMKMANGEYVLPDSVTHVYKNTRIVAYKENDTLKASVGFYRDEYGPGDPKQAAVRLIDYQFDSEDDMERVKAIIDGKKVAEGRTFNSRGDEVDTKPKGDGAVGDMSKFKKGQRVKIKKTGKLGTIMSFNDGGIFVRHDDAPDFKITKKMVAVPGKGYESYLPRELEAK